MIISLTELEDNERRKRQTNEFESIKKRGIRGEKRNEELEGKKEMMKFKKIGTGRREGQGNKYQRKRNRKKKIERDE